MTPPSDTPTPKDPKKLHLAFLDGVRALAALFVVAHHIFWSTYSTVPVPGLKGLATNWLLYGHLSVDVFIVLSGFCLMLPVSRSGLLRGGWRTFYARRARRILPPLYAALGLAVALTLRHGTHIGKGVLLANALLLQDWLPARNTLDGPLWSVALECKIYFLFPLLVLLWRRSGPVAALAVSAAIGWGLTTIFRIAAPGWTLDHACPWYVFLFGAGMCAADTAIRGWVTTRQGLAALLLSAVVWVSVLCLWPITIAGDASPYNTHLPLIDTVTGMLTAVSLMLLCRTALAGTRSPLLSALSWGPLVWIGTFSYSIYLIHILLIYGPRNWMLRHLSHHPAPLVILVTMAIVVGVAYLFHLAFERPFMSSPPRRPERQPEIAAVSPAP